MREDSALAPARVNSRVNSIDIMRGFTILLMAFVNDLRDFMPVKDVPQWLRHMDVGIDGYTLVDLIMPVFIFLLGVSVPLALGKRLSQNQSTLKIAGHVLMRSGSLIVMGLMDVNRWEGRKLLASYGMMLDWPLGLWRFLAWTFIFVVWLDFPKESRWAVNAHRIARVFALAGLIWLALVFRTSTGGRFTTSWWATLGQLGWAYLFASATWLVFRNNRLGIIGVFVLMHSAFIGMKSGLAEGNPLVAWIGPSLLGATSANAIAGLYLGSLLSDGSGHVERIRRALGLALFTGIAALLLQPVGGLHSPSTSWSLSATTAALVLWAPLYWCADVRGWTTGLGPFRTIGTNSLLLYQLSRYWIFVYWLSGLTFYETLAESTALGLARALVYTLFLGAMTLVATKYRVMLRV
jgi:heparan-alpha-glucosaminide N-acetyltransferase